MSEALAVYPLWVVRRCVELARSAVVERLLLDGPGVVVAPEASPGASFEAWLLARSLLHIRSEAFRESAEYEMLMAEWERTR